MDKIYCVKVAQRRLPSGAVVPFDRMYLVPKDNEEFVGKMFRYALSFQMTPTMELLLDECTLSKTRTITVKRDDLALAGEKPKKGYKVVTDEILAIDPIIVVPTMVRLDNVSKNSVSKVQYLMTRAIKLFAEPKKNPKIAVHQAISGMKLHTPNKIIPAPCALCVNILKYHAGECSFATKTCGREHLIRLPYYDPHFSQTEKRSLEAAGGA